jgi:cyclic AMP-dependent transcription factor ATF-4
MDSLELPTDLIWGAKLEPLSPNQLLLVNPEDIMIFDNDFSSDLIFENSDIRYNGKKSAEELLVELQEEIIDVEDFDANQWLEETITLPSLADYIHPQRQPLKVEQTAQLLHEFDSVFDAVELTHLTPPQTPPESPKAEHFDDVKLGQYIFASTSQPQQQQPQPQQPTILNSNFFNFDTNESIQSPACSQDIAHEMEVVEELVRSCAENLPDYASDDESYSPSSTSSSPRSDDSFDNASPSYTNDDELSPPSPVLKKRTKPYGRSLSDKKFRKKEQNKNAATRYRQKKKAEIEVVLEEERELQEKNDRLQEKYADVKREVKFLKSLLRELYRANGHL